MDRFWSNSTLVFMFEPNITLLPNFQTSRLPSQVSAAPVDYPVAFPPVQSTALFLFRPASRLLSDREFWQSTALLLFTQIQSTTFSEPVIPNLSTTFPKPVIPTTQPCSSTAGHPLTLGLAPIRPKSANFNHSSTLPCISFSSELPCNST